VISLDSLINTIQQRHHDVRSHHIALSNDCAVHDLSLECAPLFLCPLTDPALGTDCRHDSTHKDQQDFAKNNPKNILSLLGHKKFGQNISSKMDSKKNVEVLQNHHNQSQHSRYASHKFQHHS
jgi:hypothetical protein